VTQLQRYVDSKLKGLVEVKWDAATGRSSSFELSIGADKKLLYSKLKTGDFPDEDSLLQAIKAVADGKEATEVKANS